MALILAVDDEPGILKLVNQILSEEGFRVVTARDGEEAVGLQSSIARISSCWT